MSLYSAADQKELTELSKNLLKDNFSSKNYDPQKLLDDLKRVLVFHEWRYYIKNDPFISDFEYDQLYKRLEAIEQEHPEWIKPDSPTQRVSNDLTQTFESVAHLTPMLSLDNSYNAEDLKDFDEQVKKLALIDMEADVEYVVEPKFDGGSIALVYEDDHLVRAATRGNGVMGEEITANARVIRTVPLKADFSKYGIKKAELRGEVLIRKDIFKKMNDKRQEEGLELFANPRNTAAGGLRMKDPKEASQRGLEAFVYTLGFGEDENGNDVLSTFPTHEKSMRLLGDLGFLVPGEAHKVCKNIQEVIEFCQAWEERRESYEYEIDGMVIKVNDRVIQDRAGFTSHHPRWAIAFKFKAKQGTTKLLNVEYQVGKVGSITPVAKVEPVALAGVTISSISLHNEDFIKEKDIRLGDTVLVERAGDVIPYIVKPMAELRDGSEQEIQFPSNCPVCNTELVKPEGEAAWRCVNYDCEAQVKQRLIHHVSKDAMDIDGLGRSMIERFFELGMIDSLADIYRLDYDKIMELEGFGSKSAENLRASIEKAKHQPVYRFLYSLSIHHLGKKVSQLLAAQINHVLDLKDWTLEQFTDIKDVGPTVAENVMAFFHNENNIHLLEEMESLGVNMTQTEDDKPKALNSDGPLFGKTILFTGTLLKMGRKEAQEKAVSAGAKNLSSVSSNLDILVVGEKAGSKLKKAQALGTVTIYTEDEFLEIITGN
ncbi:MAG: NAD-dependent DNA ligase LigA [Saprospiraceae bacterium]